MSLPSRTPASARPDPMEATAAPPGGSGPLPWRILVEAFNGFTQDDVPRLGAALAYYTAFSLAPLLVVLLAVASWFFDSTHVRDYLLGGLGDAVGPGAADAIDGMVRSLQEKTRTASAIAAVTTVLGATVVLMELKGVLDRIFGARPPHTRIPLLTLVLTRLKTLMLLVVLVGLLVVSLVLSGVVHAVLQWVSGDLPVWLQVARIVNPFMTVLTSWLLYVTIFRLFPHRPPSDRAALLGALVTALLFLLGRQFIGFYLSVAGTASAFGAAGALAVVLVWVYFSAQIMLFGAELCRALDRVWLRPRAGGQGQ